MNLDVPGPNSFNNSLQFNRRRQKYAAFAGVTRLTEKSF